MDKISNTEKQSRFRQKEKLKRRADDIFRRWELQPWRWNSNQLQDVRHCLDRAIDLKPGWTGKDYEYAEQILEQLEVELFLTSDQLASDVEASWNPQKFMTTPDPVKLMSDQKAALKATRALAAHLISALKLSNCNEANQAAALMEALRSVGRSLVSSSDVPHSQATIMCLGSIAPHYRRPDWFPHDLLEIIHQPIDRSHLYQ